MRLKKLYCFYGALSILAITTCGEPCLAGDISVQVQGFRNDKGVVRFQLFNSAKDFNKHDDARPIKQEIGKVIGGSTNVQFKDLLPGEYALRYFHDEDNSGKPHIGFGKMPEMGFSNNVKPGLNFANIYEQAKFIVGEKDTHLLLVVSSGMPFHFGRASKAKTQ